jgi:hypothetical protein
MFDYSETGFIIYMSVLFLFGTIFNFLILLVYRKKYTLNVSLFLLFTLAFVDFVISLFIVPLTVFTSIGELYINSKFFCGLTYFMRYFSTSVSVILLALIAFERYNTISAKTMNKLRQTQNDLIRNCKKVTGVAIFICFIYSIWCFYFFNNGMFRCVEIETTFYYNIICVLVLGAVMLTMVVLYFKAYIIVHESTTKIYNRNIVLNRTVCKPNSTDPKMNTSNNSVETLFQTETSINNNLTLKKLNRDLNNNNKRTSEHENRLDSTNKKISKIGLNKPIDLKKIREEVEVKQEKPIVSETKRIKTNLQNEDSKLKIVSQTRVIVKCEKLEIGQPLSSNSKRSYTEVCFVETTSSTKSNSNEQPSKQKEKSNQILSIENLKLNKKQSSNEASLNDCSNQNELLKRKSNLNISSMAIRKDWRVAKMFILVN